MKNRCHLVASLCRAVEALQIVFARKVEMTVCLDCLHMVQVNFVAHKESHWLLPCLMRALLHKLEPVFQVQERLEIRNVIN